MSRSESVAPRTGLLGLHHRLYRWVLRWAAHRQAQTALFVLALAEASFFPVPPDVLLIAMCLATRARAARYALIATTGSVLGGLLGYGIGMGAWRLIEGWAFAHLGFLGFTPDNFAAVQTAYQGNAFLALFGAAFSPIPYKVFTIAAGVFQIGIPVFVVASLIGRAGRFGLVALLLYWFGPSIQRILERYLGWLTLAFVVLLALGFWLVSTLGGP